MKRYLALVLSLGLMISLFGGCGKVQETNSEKAYTTKDTWLIEWYLCGTDLESENGAATADLHEVLDVKLPDNVKVLIQTGGTKSWQNETIDPGKLQRYEYSGNELKKVDEQKLANMGDSSTLASFLQYGQDNYKVDHRMFLFWDHGGGSVDGVAVDELFDRDTLKLDEISQAFKQVYPDASQGNVPFELIGFDACLMATIDTAASLQNIANYMVASEEYEPGCGWSYTKWLSDFVSDTAVAGDTIGTLICDSYKAGCEENQVGGDVTLSVINLNTINNLLDKYKMFGDQALIQAVTNDTFFAKFGRGAVTAENYGGNNRDTGYTNMVDMGDLASQVSDIIPEQAADLENAIAKSVVYSVQGPYRSKAKGISCYYSYNSDADNLEAYKKICCSEPFKYLYELSVMGTLSEDGVKYVNSLGVSEPQTVEGGDAVQLDNSQVTINDDGYATVNLGAQVASRLNSIYFQLVYMNEDLDIMMMLGRDNDITADWDNGVFEDNFRNMWGAIDGHLVTMEITYEGDDYNLYNVPIKLNGQECNLCVAYVFEDKEYYILGARTGVDENGMADKNLIQLMEGDEITTQFTATTMSGDDDWKKVDVDTFEITQDTTFKEIELGDGEYGFMFEMVDAHNVSYYSQMAQLDVVDGEITAKKMGE